MYRKATIYDCEQVHNLICDMEHRELPYARFQEIYNNQMSDENYYCLICEQDNQVIGMLNLRFEEQLHHAENIAEIMEFAVDSAFRNQGIGRGMLERACVIAKERGSSQIEVACNQLRKDTHRFYLREGMKNYHFKFSKRLDETDSGENMLGR